MANSVCGVYIMRSFKSFRMCMWSYLAAAGFVSKVDNWLTLLHLTFQMCTFHLSDYFLLFSVPPVSYFLEFIIDCLHNAESLFNRAELWENCAGDQRGV